MSLSVNICLYIWPCNGLENYKGTTAMCLRNSIKSHQYLLCYCVLFTLTTADVGIGQPRKLIALPCHLAHSTPSITIQMGSEVACVCKQQSRRSVMMLTLLQYILLSFRCRLLFGILHAWI